MYGKARKIQRCRDAQVLHSDAEVVVRIGLNAEQFHLAGRDGGVEEGKALCWSVFPVLPLAVVL